MKRRWLCCFLLVFCLAGCGATQEAIDREQMLQEAAELHEDALQGVIDAQKNLRETLVVQSDAANSNRDITIEIGETGSSKNFDVSFIDFWTQEQIYTETYSEYTEYYKTPTRGSTYAIIVRFLYKGIIINHNKKPSQPTLKRRFFKKKAAFFSWPGLGKEWC